MRSTRHPAVEPLARAMRTVLHRQGTLCVLDLQPTLGVQVAARVADLAHPVLVLPRWPYADAVLPTETLLATLLAEAPNLPTTTELLPNVVLVLDAERSRAIRRRRADPRADNRYPTASLELPDLKTLRARGIGRIHRLIHA
ncbi:MAG TPA: hypothetical protein VFG86_15485 [Chloroflexota bacterium]|nr:hypothetical protein [Chloroflexota bacterium]